MISIKKSRVAASFCGFPARKGDTAFIWCASHYRFLQVSPRDLRISVVRGSTGKVFRSESWSRSSRNPPQNLVHYSMSLNLLYCTNSPGKITFRVSPPRLLLLYRATLERFAGNLQESRRGLSGRPSNIQSQWTLPRRAELKRHIRAVCASP